jgi:hypothetical protein
MGAIAARNYLFDRTQDGEQGMSIWSELLFLHGHLTRVHEGKPPARPAHTIEDEAERLREVLGCRSDSTQRPEPRGPLLGVRGLI